MPYLYSTLWIDGKTVTDLWANAEKPIKTMWVADDNNGIKKVWDKYLKIGVEEVESPLFYIGSLCYADNKLLILGTKEDPNTVYNQKLTICFLNENEEDPQWHVYDSYFLFDEWVTTYRIFFSNGYFYFDEGMSPTGYITTPDTTHRLFTRTDGYNFWSFQPFVWYNDKGYSALGIAGIGEWTICDDYMILSPESISSAYCNWNACKLPEVITAEMYFDHHHKTGKVTGRLIKFGDLYYMQSPNALLKVDEEHVLDYAEYEKTTYDSYYNGLDISCNERLFINELRARSASAVRYMKYSTDGENFNEFDYDKYGINIQKVGHLSPVQDCFLIYLTEYVVDDVMYDRVLLVLNKDGNRQAWTQIPNGWYLGTGTPYAQEAFTGDGMTKYARGLKIVNNKTVYKLLKLSF